MEMGRSRQGRAKAGLLARPGLPLLPSLLEKGPRPPTHNLAMSLPTPS